MANKKLVVMSNVVLKMFKITNHKLNEHDYLDWGKIVLWYLRNIDMDNHIIEDPPTDNFR